MSFRAKGMLEDALNRVWGSKSAVYITALKDAKTGLVNRPSPSPRTASSPGGISRRRRTKPGTGCSCGGLNSAPLQEIALVSLTENAPSKIIARAPGAGLATGQSYRLIIKTKFFGGGNLLKDVWVIESPFTLTAKS